MIFRTELQEQPDTPGGLSVYVLDNLGRYLTLADSPTPTITASQERAEALLIVYPELVPALVACLRSVVDALGSL